jgi:hypothetical protein
MLPYCKNEYFYVGCAEEQVVQINYYFMSASIQLEVIGYSLPTVSYTHFTSHYWETYFELISQSCGP